MTASGPSDEVIETGASLWAAFTAAAGLNPDTYDRDLEAEVRSLLGIIGNGSTRDEIRAAAMSPRVVLHALLTTLTPFARMLTDLLNLYSSIGARSAQGANLRMTYEFGPDEEKPLSFDVERFREWSEAWSKVMVDGFAISGSNEQLVQLRDALGVQRRRTPLRAEAVPLAAAYESGEPWPQTMPRPPATTNLAVGSLLAEVFTVAESVLQFSRAWSTSPAELRQRRNQRSAAGTQPNGDPASQDALLAQSNGDSASEGALVAQLDDLHRDHWLKIMVTHSYNFADMATQNHLPAGAAGQVRQVLDQLPRVQEEQQRIVKTLIDVLALPAWQRRHELYSAWLLTQMVDAMGRDRVAIHVVDGELRFAFSGTHVATVASDDGPLELWAELRHPYATPIGEGRKKGIQPDYTLSLPPITRDESAVLVVEAKQYKRGHRDRFLKALTDYTNGHTRAAVLLANYGKTPKSVEKEAPQRAEAFEQVRPGSESAQLFKQAIEAAVPPLTPVAAQAAPSESRDVQATPSQSRDVEVPADSLGQSVTAFVTLDWAEGGDLDLYLVDRHGAVTSFASIVYQTSDSTIQLWNDDLVAPGHESAYVRESAHPVAIWVHRFSGDTNLSDAQAVVSVDRPGKRRFPVPCPTAVGSFPWWFVGILDAAGDLDLRNTGHEHFVPTT